MVRKTKGLLFIAIIALCFSACKDDDMPMGNELPTTYNFENVSYSGQTARLDMLAEMTTEMKRSNNGDAVDGTKLLDMFSNTNSAFNNADLNASTKQLKNKCFDVSGTSAYSASSFEYYFNLLATKSAANGSSTWAPGQAGVATSGSKNYFLDENGVEYTQIIEKGLMGAIFYYQACETYTREGKIGNGVNNEIVEPGKGTDMEHHWDEAFGYFGAPTDLTSANYEVKEDAGESRYHAKYAGKGQDAGLNTVQKIMDEFIKGRFGISNNDNAMRDAAAAQLRKEWEMVLATTAIHYINSAQGNFGDDALRNHALSEAYAFILSLHYNSDKLITDAELSTVKGYFEVEISGQKIPSFLSITVADLNAAKNELSTVYGLDSVKESL